METEELRGGALAKDIREKVALQAAGYKERGILPSLVAVVMGHDPSVQSYLEVKARAAAKLGIDFRIEALDAKASEADLIQLLRSLSANVAVHGIVLELPLPAHVNADSAIAAIDPKKDVDGLTAYNLGLALAGREEDALLSATAKACIRLAESAGPLDGARVVLVGRGRTVGRPLVPMLLNRGVTLTVCHTRTKDLKTAIQAADVIFLGAGKPGLLTADMVRPEQVVIDAGTTMVGDKLLGDAAPEVMGAVRALTPVPEGVGPLTTACIFENLMNALILQGI